MQDRRHRISARMDFLRGARAGMVRHHAPTLGGSHIHIGGQHKSQLWPVRHGEFDAFDQIVHGAGDGFHFAHMFWVRGDGAVAEHGFKRLPNVLEAHEPGSAGVHANHFFIV